MSLGLSPDRRADAARHVAGRAREMAQWRRRSSRIKQVRRILPWTIAGLAMLVVGWIGGRAIIARLGAGARELAVIRMLHPNYRGRDDHGEPYVLSAESATRDPRDPYQVQLVQPRMQLATQAPQPARMRAIAGIYNEDKSRLTMVGDAVLQDGSGYVFNSERAVIDVKAGTATGDQSVVGDGPLGHVTASSYAITDKGRHITFKGNVKTHLVNQ